MFDLGGWHAGVFLMIAIDIAAVVVLGMAISYGSRMWREEPQQPRSASPATPGSVKVR